jgi:hypothetical protein
MFLSMSQLHQDHPGVPHLLRVAKCVDPCISRIKIQVAACCVNKKFIANSLRPSNYRTFCGCKLTTSTASAVHSFVHTGKNAKSHHHQLLTWTKWKEWKTWLVSTKEKPTIALLLLLSRKNSDVNEIEKVKRDLFTKKPKTIVFNSSMSYTYSCSVYYF